MLPFLAAGAGLLAGSLFSKPSAPKPADPAKTAGAQMGMNVNTAIANQILGQTNQIGPNGSLTYRQTGSQTIRDPNTGETYKIPQYTARTRLDPQLAQANRINQRTQVNLAQTGNKVSRQLENHFDSQFNLNGVTRGGQAQKVSNGWQNTVGRGPNLQENIAQGAIRNSFNNGGAIDREISGVGGVASSFGRGGDIDRSIGNVGGVAGQIAGAGSIDRSIGNVGGVTGNIANAGDLTRTYGTDWSKDRQRVEDALMQRMNPSLQQDRQALEARLASQGIAIGSKAYQDAMGDFSQQSNDARLGAILGAGQEQSRLAGLARDRATFENSAQQQAFGQNAMRSQFSNDAQQQRFAQEAARSAFTNQAQAQQFGQNATRSQFANDAQQQRFGQEAARSQFANQAQAQAFGQNQALAQFGNDAQQQRFGQEAARSQFRNAAQQQAYTQNQGLAQFFNQAQGQQFTQDAQQAAFRNAARQGEYDNQTARVQQNNAARTQQQANDIRQEQYRDSLRARDIQERLLMRNQPLNEVAALMSGSQVSMPQFGATPQGTVANTDYAGLVANRDQMNQQNHQAQMAFWGDIIGGGMGAGATMYAASDRRVKTDIKKAGKTNDGQQIYSFRYKSGGPIQLGLMAQDVEKKKPEAVKTMGGIKMVDYGKALK